MKFLKISTEEKNIQFIYIICLWCFFSVLFVLISFDRSTTHDIRGSHIILQNLSKIKEDQAEQLLNIKHIDTLRLLLSQYNPTTNQSYTESSIVYEINELNKIYNSSKQKKSNIYTQLAQYYNMVLFDKNANATIVKNCDYLKNNLNECEIGFQQNQNNINLQEVLKKTNYE